MGMISKVLGLKVAHMAAQKLHERGERKQAQHEAEQLGAAQAGLPVRAHGVRQRGNAIARKAGDFYHRNPKLVASFATVVLAGLAATLAKRRGMY